MGTVAVPMTPAPALRIYCFAPVALSLPPHLCLCCALYLGLALLISLPCKVLFLLQIKASILTPLPALLSESWFL